MSLPGNGRKNKGNRRIAMFKPERHARWSVPKFIYTRLLTLTYTDSYRFLMLKSYPGFRTASMGQYPLGSSV